MADPMVVVDDLHVVYKVYGAGGDRGTAATVLLRLLGRKTRGSIREVHAIRGISFVANRGDAIGVIGRNGSGKSTLCCAPSPACCRPNRATFTPLARLRCSA